MTRRTASGRPFSRGLVLLAALLAITGCGPEDRPRVQRADIRILPGVDELQVLPDGRRIKSVLTNTYLLDAWRVAYMAEPFRTRPFSRDEAAWITSWRSNTEDPDGVRAPDDIHCHAFWSDVPVGQDGMVFAGLYTDGFTPEFDLPKGFGIRIPAGQRMIFQPMFNNRRPDPREARMRLDVEFQLDSELTEPLVALSSFTVSSSKPDLYWIPPREPGTEFYRDVKTRAIEVPASGRVHAIGAHLHPHGKFVELKRQRSGEVVFTARLLEAQRLEDMRLTTYQSGEGFYIRQGERFVITTVYESPLDEKLDAMGGVFVLYDPNGEPDA